MRRGAHQVRIRLDFVREMLRYYAWLNPGLTLILNGEKFRSKDGLVDLLQAKLTEEPLYPVIHLEGKDVEDPSDVGNTCVGAGAARRAAARGRASRSSVGRSRKASSPRVRTTTADMITGRKRPAR